VRDITIAVVTALSPSGTTLAEYGLHLLTALGRKPGVRVIALVEDLAIDYPHIAGVEVRRAWRFDALGTPIRLARAARAAGADIVIVNAHFTSFGSSKAAAAIGLLTPLVLRLTGTPVITLLHNIVETVDLAAAGFRAPRPVEAVLRAIGTTLTWLVLRSTLVTTTMPRYVDILRSKYRAENVALTPHGAFDVPPPPAASAADKEIVMTFGKFGTYKKVEMLIEAVRSLRRPGLALVIAGTDSPNTPGYLAAVHERLGGDDVRFLGYVPEDAVESVFRSATITVFPYSATTGSSGVLHQAGAFGCPPVLPRLGDLEELIIEEGYTGAFFDPDDVSSLARSIEALLDDPTERARIAAGNYAAAVGLSLEQVADWYLLHIGRILHDDPLALLPSGAELHKVL
jgi:glycosyltransferase involved in cell wall biosynthesis